MAVNGLIVGWFAGVILGAGGLIRASSQLRPRDGSAADAPLSEAQMTFRV